MSSIFELTHSWAKDNNLSFWQKPETESTNKQAKDEAFTVSPFKIYVTDHQTAGRGRHANNWSDTKNGSQLLSTWAYTLDTAPQHILPPLVGLALFNAAQNVWPQLQWSLKAPNDLFLKDKKVAGLLIENIQQGDDKHFVGLGLGFNVSDSPEEIETCTHLTSPLGTGEELKDETWLEFLNQLHENFKQATEFSGSSQITKEKRDELLRALNANPLKKEIYLEVTDQGDLVSESQTISWKDI